MHASSGAAALPLSVPSSPPGDAYSRAAFRCLLDLRGVRGAAATDARPSMLVGDCSLRRCTVLTGGEAASPSGAARPARARATRRWQGVWGAEHALVATGMVAWGKSSRVDH